MPCFQSLPCFCLKSPASNVIETSASAISSFQFQGTRLAIKRVHTLAFKSRSPHQFPLHLNSPQNSPFRAPSSSRNRQLIAYFRNLHPTRNFSKKPCLFSTDTPQTLPRLPQVLMLFAMIPHNANQPSSVVATDLLHRFGRLADTAHIPHRLLDAACYTAMKTPLS